MDDSIDSLLLEIIRNGFSTVADEMALILMRSAHSMIVRDSMDYSTAICDAEGRIVGQGLTTPMHLGSFYDAMRHLIGQFEGRIREGDLYIGNDPYLASGQHLPDIYIIAPIFHDGMLEGFATTIAHHADVGGIVAGSNSIGATEIYQEGLRLPFLKLWDAGAENGAILDIVRANVRVPEKVIGDLKAQIAACRAGIRGYGELFARYGSATVRRYIEALHDYAEALARLQIEAMPDGVYSFEDRIDGLGENPAPIVLKVTVTISGSDVTTDWTGTAEQVKGGINAPLSFLKSNVYAALRSVMSEDVPNCHGFTRAIHVVAPAGTLVNATHPAPCGARGITGYRIADCLFGALAQAVPERVTADGAGGSTLPTIAGWRDGEPFVFSECVMGTWGAAQGHDGQSGVPHMCSNQSNVPIEMIEAEYPIRIERYGYVADTAGPGRQRGGLGLVREYRTLATGLSLSVRADKQDFPPHGLEGGEKGAPCSSVLNPGSNARTLPMLFTAPVPLDAGDLFRHVMAGGGGFGPALERDPEAVLADVIDGLVTVEGARRDYGVIIAGTPLAVDRASTLALRSAAA
ncbi:hydantoinase B/oxoprolinase family protein [Aquabacter sp. P-9]|uniref:hydantoinase B/oxoprolinase family protein n=1 Tax=Aquabacter sediminis TaxID=3029197 RepID=UPI00237DAD0A|nr:hydantoinase B/oxoprolinase family protein [Aquabacter sp. P-9]MDE1571155.1 hydantoinase B/oxoprolinase family protein [Aquabacter sp. P-9]